MEIPEDALDLTEQELDEDISRLVVSRVRALLLHASAKDACETMR